MDEDKQRLASEDTMATPLTIEEQKLAIERERLKLDLRKERTAKLQLILPLAISVVAIVTSFASEFYRSRQASRLDAIQAITGADHKEGRVELFKKLTQEESNPAQVREIYKEVFADDARRLGMYGPEAIRQEMEDIMRAIETLQ